MYSILFRGEERRTTIERGNVNRGGATGGVAGGYPLLLWKIWSQLSPILGENIPKFSPILRENVSNFLRFLGENILKFSSILRENISNFLQFLGENILKFEGEGDHLRSTVRPILEFPEFMIFVYWKSPNILLNVDSLWITSTHRMCIEWIFVWISTHFTRCFFVVLFFFYSCDIIIKCFYVE